MNKTKDAMGERQEHPSYGSARISYHHHHPKPLFMSSVQHMASIVLTISTADLRRSLNQDDHYTRQPLVEVAFSASQFSEFIMSQGKGNGVPCTIRYREDQKRIPDPPFEDKRAQFVSEFAEKVKEVGDRLDALVRQIASLADKPSVTKAERKDLLSQVQMARQEINANMPFVASQFNEEVDRIILQGKGEMEAYETMVLRRFGVERLQQLMDLANGGEAVLVDGEVVSAESHQMLGAGGGASPEEIARD